MRRLPLVMAAVLFLAVTLTAAAGQEKARSFPCPCGCEECSCELPAGRLFDFPKDRLLGARLVNDYLHPAVFEGEDAERVVDLLNSFVVVSAEESEGGPIGSNSMYVNLYDSMWFLQPSRAENAIYVGKMKYTLEPWCIEELYRMHDEAQR